MAHETTPSEPSSWNPAFRPDDHEGPTAIESGEDSGDQEHTTEAPATDPEDARISKTDDVESHEVPAEAHVSETAPSADTDEKPVVSVAEESNQPSDAGVDTTEEPSVEQSGEVPEGSSIVVETGNRDTEAVADNAAPLETATAGVHVAEAGPTEAETSETPDNNDPFAAVEQNNAEGADAFDTTAWMNGQEDGSAPMNTNGEMESHDHGFWNNTTDGTADAEGDGFFDQLTTQTKPIYEESRYEEGVPLLDETPLQSPVEPSAPSQSNIDQVFDGNDDEADGFFSEIQKSPPEKPEHLGHIQRKSTSQVMDSLDTVLDSPASDASPTTQNFNDLINAPKSENQVERVSSDEDLTARWQAELETEVKESPGDLNAQWQADLTDNHVKEPTEDDLAARWQAELDDDDLLLEDDGGDQITEPQNTNFTNEGTGLNSPFETPQNSAGTKAQAAYTPHQPSTSDLLQASVSSAPQISTAPPANYFSSQPQPTRPAVNRAESFVDRSQQGYKSPYDLPEDFSRPRRAPASFKTVVPGPGAAPTPARSSSIPPPPMGTAIPAPPAAAPPQAPAVPTAPKNFYEELPLPPPRPRSRPTSSGRYTPNQTPATTGAPPPPPAQANPYANIASVPQTTGPSPPRAQGNPHANVASAPQTTGSPPPPAQVNPYANVAAAPQLAGGSQLQREKLDPYANLLPPNPPAVPNAASRYSPAPPGLHAGVKPPPSPRYSPAPPPQSSAPPRNLYVPQQPNVSPNVPSQVPPLPFQPRTSSPLAYHEKISYQPEGPQQQRSLEPAASLSPSHFQQRPSIDQGSLPGLSGENESHGITTPANQQHTSPPRNPYAPPAYLNDFANRTSTLSPPGPPALDVRAAPLAGDSQFAPPRRSQTQSPSQQMAGPRLSVPSVDPLQRPASVHGSGSPTKTVNPYAPTQASHIRSASQSLEFISPNDGQQLDHLERWKGAPIVKFGFGGAITACFPKHIPRYFAGQTAPMIKSSPGEVKICQLNEWLPTGESIVQHPGPLKGKSKKKDLLAWLSSKIAALENEGLSEAAQLHPDSHKRHEEKVLLWKIVRILVENDGTLEGSVEVQSSLHNVIFPHLQNSRIGQSYTAGFVQPGMSQPLDAPSRPDAADPQSVETLWNNLLIGDREKAVWDAVDHRLWGHAMVISSTMDKSVWKQVVQEFVRREVRSTSGNTESLAALYEIFAGNVEESIDELVPPSARAGHQMISKVNGQGPAKNALDGLESWKDTLGLVLNNRSPEDHQALLALGRLLLSYGRVEAAHICFIFSRTAVFSGVDDPQANIVLLGADHHRFPSMFAQDEDAILLTEVYEYATSVLAGNTTHTFPHLLAYKLLYASYLADRGCKSEAQQYCDAIAGALKATTRPSVYHHQHLFSGVDELSARLRQTTTDAGSSWIPRPSMEKVSGSMWARFNSFVAGDDSDAASTGSGKADADVGPFAKVSGTPTVSRSPSMSDLYSYPAPGAQPPPSGASKYHPGSQYAPNSSPEQLRGRSSLDSQRSSSFGYSFGQRRGSQEPATPVDTGLYQGGPFYNSPSASGYQSTPPQTSYMPLAPVEEDLAPPTQPDLTPASVPSSAPGSSYAPPMSTFESFGQPLHDQNSPVLSQPDSFGYMPPSSTGGYEPPGAGGFTPAVEVQDETTEEEPKKKSMMDDDDDDLAARSAAIQKAEKERKDREADEAFRKAAEADAQKPPPPKKSWFGGWFGGGGGDKKEDHNPNKPIRAKLGEENSFYYDTDLKKWVNKKDPNSATPARGTPPPPKAMAPPSRSVSGTSAPPSAVGSVAGSRPGSSAGAPPPPLGSSGPPSLGIPPPLPRSVSTGAAVPTPSSTAPPPRPATSLSNASSIDDLIGAPTARKGPAAKGKKKGRYVDVMAK